MRFTFACWLVTRLIIAAAVYAASAHAPVQAAGNWDGGWYGRISLDGYGLTTTRTVAFFPLFPLISSLLVRAGLGWPLAGIAVNNAAFLGGALVFYAWVKGRYGLETARWASATLCALPLSLFGSVAYSEGLFALAAAVTLLCYERKWYLAAGAAAACASATRPLGIALALAIAVGAIVERRGTRAVLACATGMAGIATYALFCRLRFGDALAFVHAQNAWRGDTGFDASGWEDLMRGALHGRIHDWLSLLALFAAVAAVVGARRLGSPARMFLAFAVAILIAAGEPLSIDRNLYSVVPLVAAIGAVLARARYAGYVVIAASLAILVLDAVAFARFTWVA